jgi:hypothetical protein
VHDALLFYEKQASFSIKYDIYQQSLDCYGPKIHSLIEFDRQVNGLNDAFFFSFLFFSFRVLWKMERIWKLINNRVLEEFPRNFNEKINVYV